ncbi:hypothetical protein C4D60_Mb08t13810 [Musa balbisiana]|uniref:Uncharacterized protein n=1 Tax=Musa balbisiana TaxID=52838 RepID=A0A4S8K3K4_MUSBA|nr:hypothetical protein C4D60_Mb08t13810 [Musa balbisiana]
MDSILLDQSQVNPRKVSLDVAADSRGRFVPRAIHGSLSSYSSLTQHLPDHHAAVCGFRSCVSRPLQPPQRQLLYAFLPSSFCADLMGGVPPPPPHHHHLPPLPLLQQPPLLPLPLTKSTTLPPSPKVTRTNTGTGMARSRDHRTKPKPWASSKKETQSSTKAAGQPREPKDEPQKPMREGVAIVSNDGEGKEEEEEEIYSLSPPPANLPLPSFLLTRHRDACNTQVIMEGGAGGRG